MTGPIRALRHAFLELAVNGGRCGLILTTGSLFQGVQVPHVQVPLLQSLPAHAAPRSQGVC